MERKLKISISFSKQTRQKLLKLMIKFHQQIENPFHTLRDECERVLSVSVLITT